MTEVLIDPKDYARERLCLLMYNQGLELLNTSNMFEVILNRYCQQEPDLVKKLMKAMDQGIVKNLLAIPRGPERDKNRGAWVEQLCRQGKLKPRDAQWVMDTWEMALEFKKDAKPNSLIPTEQRVDSSKGIMLVLMLGLLLHFCCFPGYALSDALVKFMGGKAAASVAEKAFKAFAIAHGIGTLAGLFVCMPTFASFLTMFGIKPATPFTGFRDFVAIWLYSSAVVFVTLFATQYIGLIIGILITVGLIGAMGSLLSYHYLAIMGLLYGLQLLAVIVLIRIPATKAYLSALVG